MSVTVWKPAAAEELSRLVAENAQTQRRPLAPLGGGTLLHLGYPVTPEAISVSTAGLTRVVDYPSGDMTITVESGMTLAALQAELNAQGQRLPIDVPAPERSTIGGAIAANVSGPSRFGYGTFRDYVIGVSAVDGQGRLFSAGGRVVKNVAGYDLCKLLTGSLGTLAIITQVTLKVRPQAESCRALIAHATHPSYVEALLTELNTSSTRPVIVDVLSPGVDRGAFCKGLEEAFPDAGYLAVVVFEGGREEVDWQCASLLQEWRSISGLSCGEFADAAELRQASTEFPRDAAAPLTFSASLLPSQVVGFLEQAGAQHVALLAHAASGVVVGRLPERCANAAAALEIVRPLRHAALTGGGSLTVLRCDDGWKQELDIFGPPTPAWKLMDGLRAALDPLGLLAPGRFGRPLLQLETMNVQTV